jgi:hypothetical protein
MFSSVISSGGGIPMVLMADLPSVPSKLNDLMLRQFFKLNDMMLRQVEVNVEKIKVADW